MVQISATLLGRDDSLLVEVKHVGAGVDRDSHWSFHESGLQLSLTFGLDLLVLLNRADSLGLLVLALLVFGLVWVVGLSLERMRLDPLHRLWLATTIAAFVVSVGAVNELLLGERLQLAVLDEVGSLNGASGGESPAGATVTLVFDFGDGALLHPVDFFGDGSIQERDWLFVLLSGGLLEASSLGSFLLGHISELVDGEGVSMLPLGFVMSLDDGQVLLEQGESEVELSSGLVHLVVLASKRHEFILILSGHGRGNS